jgi:hypothetical protein
MREGRLCNHITKKGQQCKCSALPGSEYCRIHQPREVWLPQVVSILLSIIITIVITYCFSQKAFESELSLRYISRPRNIPAVGGLPVVIQDGINVIINKSGFVTHKMADGPFDYRINEDGAIKIYGEIRRADGTVIVEATGDNISVLPNTGLDINSDSKACEIVDSDNNLIYQISVVSIDQWKKDTGEAALRIRSNLDFDQYNPTARAFIETQLQNSTKTRQDDLNAMLSQANKVIEMNYIHRTGDSWWCVTPEGSQLVDNLESMKEWQGRIPRLFKYPGKEYPGVRFNNQIQ